MIVKDVTNYLEGIAPRSLQEGYDNSGLIVGDPNAEVTGVLVCLDTIEEVVEEAIEKNANLIIAHHPVVFKGLKQLTGKNYIERVIISAIKNDISIYAIHTNLDNVIQGVNGKIADKLGLISRQVLAPKSGEVRKISVFVPESNLEVVRSAMFKAGAGKIGAYDECSFSSTGHGTFRGGDGTNPYLGEVGIRHVEPEVRLEVVCPKYALNKVLNAMKSAHPYEEVAADVYAIENVVEGIGAGIVGLLEKPMDEMEFLKFLKNAMGIEVVRHTKTLGKLVEKVALCGGAGSFLLNNAKASGADVYITGDFKYHEFFDAEDDIIIADIGHYESEQYTIDLLADVLREKFTTFAIQLTRVNTNPINYYI